MLDMGFKPDLDKIQKFLPNKQGRQTLLFSATVPPTIVAMGPAFLRRGYHFVDTVGVEAPQTHDHVPQELIITSIEQQIPATFELLATATQVPNHKIIIFFSTARVTGLFAEYWTAMGRQGFEIHSRKSQPARDKASAAFRASTNAVMFTSDVTARGLDYPDVTFVLQVGFTTKEQYIHRLGRTARAGKGGKGCILLAEFEQQAMAKELRSLNIKTSPFVPQPFDPRGNPIFADLSRVFQRVSDERDPLHKSACQAYQAWLAFLHGPLRQLGWNKAELVQNGNFFPQWLGCPYPPPARAQNRGQNGGSRGPPGLKLSLGLGFLNPEWEPLFFPQSPAGDYTWNGLSPGLGTNFLGAKFFFSQGGPHPGGPRGGGGGGGGGFFF
eukprot:FR743775.1.p1 GENE.FR743775.1~~FR743775.1.p1  ORF type:complete len:410 (+),score=101.64 FR743775.1:82-1230(+)